MNAFSPAAERNREPIFMALNPFLPKDARVLEIASGTGQHAVYIGGQRPDIHWQPSDRDEMSLRSIQEWIDGSSVKNVSRPIEVDVLVVKNELIAEIPGDSLDAVVSINMIHIAPWEACLALFEIAARHLKAKGTLFLYGPFLMADRDTAPSNLSFDLSLKERNPHWGIRSLETVTEVAAGKGFKRLHVIDLPANNEAVIFQKI
jgi:cyclopropane fatty-acyl-phospholipid synthase-like methyltransferase